MFLHEKNTHDSLEVALFFSTTLYNNVKYQQGQITTFILFSENDVKTEEKKRAGKENASAGNSPGSVQFFQRINAAVSEFFYKI